MVEAMYKRSPDFCRQFQNSFCFFFCKPNLEKIKNANLAFAYHQKTAFCHNSSGYYLVLILSENLSSFEGTNCSKFYAIPLIFISFKYLIYGLDGFTVHGPIMEKLINAVDNCLQQLNLHRNFFAVKKLPIVCHASNPIGQTQTELVPFFH